MRQIYGPSFAKSRAEFESAFGTEEYLLEETDKWLGYGNNPGSRRFSST